MQLKQIMRRDHWPVWKLCKSPVLIQNSWRVRFVHTCSDTKNVTQLLLKADIYRCVSKWRGIPQFMVIPKQWGKWWTPPWNGLGYMYEDIIPICILERYITLFIHIYIFIHIHVKYVYIMFVYIYIRQMPGLCPVPQRRRATHHHHHHHHHHHRHHQLNVDLNIP